MTALIVPGRDLVALLDQLRQLAHDGRGVGDGLGVAVERDDVAAQEERRSRRAPRARAGSGRSAPVSAAATSLESSIWRRHQAERLLDLGADTRLPSARPATFGIAAFITWPMSFGATAPVSAIAVATIARSSSSESSAGR